jgi:hypothetical protein
MGLDIKGAFGKVTAPTLDEGDRAELECLDRAEAAGLIPQPPPKPKTPPSIQFREMQIAHWQGAMFDEARQLIRQPIYQERDALMLALAQVANNAPRASSTIWPAGVAQEELEGALAVVAQKALTANGVTRVPAPKEEQIKALGLAELYGVIDEWDRRPWVWDGILPHSSLSLITGKSETGKSTLIYALIYSIVKGLPFFGRDCEQGRVLYLAGDPMSEIVAGKTFRNLGLDDGVIVVPDALVMNPTGMEQLQRIVKDFRPSLVVGDTLAATIRLDTDSYGQSYEAQQPLARMARDFGPNFLMSHHSQKSAIDSYSVIDSALGSVGVAAVASSRMGTKMYRRGGNRFYTFEMSNLRIGRPLEGEYIVKKFDSGLVELAGMWKTKTVELDKENLIKTLEKQDEPMAKRTLWQDLRPKPKWDAFNVALDELIVAGRIEIVKGKNRHPMFQLRGPIDEQG